MTDQQPAPAGRTRDRDHWERWEQARTSGPHVFSTLGFRRVRWDPEATVLAWDAPAEYGFPANDGYIVHGGLVATILDTAMGGAAWTVLDDDEVFLTADLRVEFLRAAHPGPLRATGTVLRRTRRVVFCAGELHDDAGKLLAASRCTQLVLPADGAAGRYGRGADAVDRPDGQGDGGAPPRASGTMEA
ncbi:MAG: PaaI family thioesterase [Actinomycetota bacterium]|nr:PaaI family thioesterase [Actinomycetota bacterium]